MFRTLAMAERLARLTGVSGVSLAARDRLAQRVGAFQHAARLAPVRLASSTQLQIAAILATARSLERDQSLRVAQGRLTDAISELS